MADTKVVLFADPDRDLLRSLDYLMGKSSEDVSIFTASDGATAVRMVCEFKPRLVVLNVDLGPEDAFGVWRRIKEAWPGCDAELLLMGERQRLDATKAQADEAGANGTLAKPFTPEQVRLVVRRGLQET